MVSGPSARGFTVQDLLMIGLVVAFFLVTWGLVVLFEKL
jgi:hypothetical protein